VVLVGETPIVQITVKVCSTDDGRTETNHRERDEELLKIPVPVNNRNEPPENDTHSPFLSTAPTVNNSTVERAMLFLTSQLS